MSGTKNLSRYWHDKNIVAVTLLPLSWLFRLLIILRRTAYRFGFAQSYQPRIPVIVVGNITVGGTGKTPVVIWLAEFLKKKGWSPGIISRGYGGTASEFPQHVRADSDPLSAGDEAVLLAQRTGCPMVIDPDRARAAQAISSFCDIIISDDGLQHYALGRTVEIAVIDARCLFGNGYCLPAGPLREPPSRLCSVDFVIINGTMSANILSARYRLSNTEVDEMTLVGLGMISLCDNALTKLPHNFSDDTVHAVAGIGNPDRFFKHLRDMGLKIIEHAFPDHHRFVSGDLFFGDDKTIIMTEKDAVKCRRFALPHHWYFPVEAKLSEDFGERLLSLLARKQHG